jgi:hypothetical protein
MPFEGQELKKRPYGPMCWRAQKSALRLDGLTGCSARGAEGVPTSSGAKASPQAPRPTR